MHILVPVKRVVDPYVRVRLLADGSGVDTRGLKMSMNPFDEVALEQALRLRTAGVARKVTVLSCGDAAVHDVLRTGLALGADAAVQVDTGGQALDPLGIARLLAAVVRSEDVGLVLCGKQAIDDDLGATGPMLAALLDWPQALSVHALAVKGTTLELSCDGDRGVERLAVELPAVLAADLRLAEPRAITLPAMMKAKKASIAVLPAAELAEAGPAPDRLLAAGEPPARPTGQRVPDVATLIEQLRRLPALATPA